MGEVEQLLQMLRLSRGHQAFLSMSNWLNHSQRFREFVDDDRNRNKIKSKLEHDIIGGLFELYVAYLLLSSPRFSILYYEKRRKGPDFEVKDLTEDLAFNVEVTRGDYTKLEIRLADWKGRLAERIRGIKSRFAIWIDVDELEDPEKTMQELEERFEEIAMEITTIIERSRDHLDTGATGSCKSSILSGLEYGISCPPRKQDSYTDFYGGSYPSLIRWVKEENALWAKVSEKLSQLRPNEINVLVVTTASNRYNFVHIPQVLTSLDEQSLRPDAVVLMTSWELIPRDNNITKWFQDRATWRSESSQLPIDTYRALVKALLTTDASQKIDG